jgi:hypothetical protein
MSLEQKKMIEEIKIQWKMLWVERLDDKVRAEGIATGDYSSCLLTKVRLFMLRATSRL